jgi:hypothetical protein
VIILHCRGVKSPIKLKFNEIVHDVTILANLSPQHASWIGFYYGKDYHALLRANNSDHNTSHNFNFVFRESDKRYRIVFQDRQGNIVFLDVMTNEMITKSPIAILSIESLISKFDSIEACYIGILWGMSHSKRLTKRVSNSLTSTKNLLHVVRR